MRISGSRGFTLIEVMMAVVVVAILAAIAYPSYQEHVAKSRRAEGKSALLKAAQVQERFFTDRNRYATLAELAPASGVTSGTTIYSGENPNVASHYTITLTPAAPTTTFTLTAQPTAAFPDPKCGNFTLTNTGLRAWSSGTNPNLCKW